jgi:dTDP-4-amino-4,6-dideoxygalactose transaminase
MKGEEGAKLSKRPQDGKTTVPFLDLSAQYRSIRESIDDAIAEVIRTSRFILGSDETKFERAFAESLHIPHAVGCACGTSALYIALTALGVPRGVEVIVPTLTYIATAEAVSLAGAVPVFVDSEPDTGLVNLEAIRKAITPKTWGIIPVHLYGQMVDMIALMELARSRGLKVIEDAAQAHAAECRGSRPGTLSEAATFSFFPGKNLGAYGDAGAIVTKDNAMAAWMRKYRNHGRQDKYSHDFVGFNFRLDGIQSAILQAKLPYLERWTDRRRAIASRYRAGLAQSGIRCLVERPYNRHVYHLFVVRHPERDRLRKALAEQGIECGIHYPIPLHLQPAYQNTECGPGSLPESESLAREVLSLPVDPGMSDDQVDYVIQQVLAHA